MVTGHAHPQNSALHADRPHPPVISNKGVLHFWPFAKYAVAFPRMSRSIFTRPNSARNRLISICSTLTALLLAGPFSRPSRFALTQLYKVCSTTPRLRAAAERVLRSCRLCHLRLLRSIESLSKGHVLRGPGQPRKYIVRHVYGIFVGAEYPIRSGLG
jgi:hypothetical protein